MSVTPLTRAWPSAGWNKRHDLGRAVAEVLVGVAVRDAPRDCHDVPGCGTVWNGPAWSAHQTDRPIASPSW